MNNILVYTISPILSGLWFLSALVEPVKIFLIFCFILAYLYFGIIYVTKWFLNAMKMEKYRKMSSFCLTFVVFGQFLLWPINLTLNVLLGFLSRPNTKNH